MNRNNVGNEPGDDFCCADMTSEERARWQEKFAARRRLTTFHQTPNIKIDITKITITDLIAGFAIEQGDHIGIHLYFANLRKLMGEKQIDWSL